MQTRSGFLTAPPGNVEGNGSQFSCPVASCHSFLAPLERDGAVEYNCVVGGHGQIALETNGKLVIVAPVILAADGTLAVLSNRPRCSQPGCDRVRRIACGRELCAPHCTPEATNCGCDDHDEEREHPSPSDAGEEPDEQPVDPWHVIGWVQDIPIRAAPAPSQARVILSFADMNCCTFVMRAGGSWIFDPSSLDAAARDELEWGNILPGSLEFMNGVGDFVKYTRGVVPVFPSVIEDSDDIGDVSLRAKTVPDLSQFPLFSYIDTVHMVEELSNPVLERCDLTVEAAYSGFFDHEPTADDLDSIRICREIIAAAPAAIRERFLALKRRPPGSWSHFVKACAAAAQVDPLATPDTRALFVSPLAFRQRRPRGRSTWPPPSSPSPF